jgi:ribose transport system permease protein
MATKSSSSYSGGWSVIKATLGQYSAQLIFLIFIFTALSIMSPVFLKANNLINVSRQISCNLYIGCALTMVFTQGGIDLSTSSIMALSGMIASLMSLAGLPFWLCAITALVACMFVGSITGTILSNTGLPPFIVTSSMRSILRGMVYVITSAASIRLTNKDFLAFGGGSLGFLPYPVIYMTVIIILTYIVMSRTKLGRQMYAMGGNMKAALFAGINVKRVRIFVYIVSGFCSGLAGLVYTSRNCSMQPALGEAMELDAIAAVVLGGTSMGGGRGGVLGTVIGAFIIGFINNGLNLLGLDSFYQFIAKGLIILLAVYLDDIKTRKLLAGGAR